MDLQVLPNEFYTEAETRQILDEWPKNNQIPTLTTLIPSFFRRLVCLDFPNDIWYVRDIIYYAGKRVLAEEAFLRSFNKIFYDEKLLKDIYHQLDGVTQASEFMRRLFDITAEAHCARLIKEVGAEEIKKSDTPADIECNFHGEKITFQVKFKNDESFNQKLIEEALLGELYKRENEQLRDMSHIVINQFTGVGYGFLKDSIDYIHNHLAVDVLLRASSFRTENIYVNICFDGKKTHVDISGVGKHEKSFLSIAFSDNPTRLLGSVIAHFLEQEPSPKLWGLLQEKIGKIESISNLIGWIELEIGFQYEDFLFSTTGREKIQAFLEKQTIPLVLVIQKGGIGNLGLIIANSEAMRFSLIRKVVSKIKK